MSNIVVLPDAVRADEPEHLAVAQRRSSTSFTASTPPKRFAMPVDLEHELALGVALDATGAAPSPLGDAPPVPLTYTARRMSGRRSSSRVVPTNRTSPFSMNTARSAIVERDVHRLLDDDDRRARACGSRWTISSSCSTTAGARPSESSSIISSLRLRQERLREREHLLLAAGQRRRPARRRARAGSGRSRTTSRVELAAFARRPRTSQSPSTQVLPHRQRREDAASARHVRRRRAGDLVRRHVRDVASVEARSRRPTPPERPLIARSSVDLPAPFVPSSATISPSSTSKSTPNSTCTPS